MQAFITKILVDNHIVEYQIFPIGKKFKALLMQSKLVNCLPCQLTFWKENGDWKTYHPLTKQVITEFGNSIDSYMMGVAVENPKKSAVA